MNKALKKTLIALLCALFVVSACFFVVGEKTSKRVFADEGVSFAVVDGKETAGNQNYESLSDGNLNTKYCVEVKDGVSAYVIFKANDFGYLVTGYTLYTANDTSTYSGRNPKSWVLYGGHDGVNWTNIHSVTGDTTMGTEDKTGYDFTFENETPYLFYKLEITARQGASGEDFDLMQLSEVKFKATVSITASGEQVINTAADLKAVFESGGKAKLNKDIVLEEDLSVYKKTVELDLNGYIICGEGKAITIYSATPDVASVLILTDSNKTRAHFDASLPLGGVITTDVIFNRKAGEETWVNKGYLYGNGGTITKSMTCDTGTATVSYFGDTMTVYQGGIHGVGVTVKGGIYYGEITATSGNVVTYGGYKLTYNNGANLFATQVVKKNTFACEIKLPTAPEDGLAFVGWYSGENAFDITKRVTADKTLTDTWRDDVASLDELKHAVASGYHIILNNDVTLTETVQLAKGKPITIDLNGYAILGNKADLAASTSIKLNGNDNGRTVLTVIDSRPNAVHADASLPNGGYVAKIEMRGSYSNPMYLYANGGTIGYFYSDTGAGYLYSTSDTPSVIKTVAGWGSIRGGLFYYNQSLNREDTSVKVFTFKDGEDVIAVEAVTFTEGTHLIYEPVPKKTDYIFDKWYNGENEWDFTQKATGDTTLTATWTEDKTAPVVSGIESGAKYCQNQEITVSGDNLDVVSLNGKRVELVDGKFTLDMSDKAKKTFKVTDKALHTVEITVTFAHDFGTWIDEVAAVACTTDGVKAHKDCTVCNKHFDADGVEIADLAIEKHDFGTWIDEVAAVACTTDGVKGHKDCTLCNKHFDADGVEITDLTIGKHTFGTWIDEVAVVACTTDGVKAHKDCSVCNKHFDADGVEIADITIEKHTFGTWIDEVAAVACTTDGVKAHKDCSVCNKHFDADGVEIADLTIDKHTFGAWVDEVLATTEEEGVKGHKDCSVCNKHFDASGVEIEDLTIKKLTKKSSGISGGAIVAIVIVSVLVVAIVAFAVVWFVVKKKTFAELSAAIKGIFKKKN